jgi:long-chain fatty acid transport protein
MTTGIAFNGFERSILAVDLRYFDYENAKGFRDSGFDSSGALRGLDWRSIFAISCGAQHQLTDRIALRSGYSFNQNPISDAVAGFNFASPTISQHFIYLGSTAQITQSSSLSWAYTHAFQNDVTGAIQTPSGPIPNSSVTSQVSLDALAVSMTVRY